MKRSNSSSYNNNLTAGLIIAMVGVVLLLQRMNFFFPTWLFSWPMFLIVIGVIVLAKHQFQSGFGAFMVLIGSIFLLKREFGYYIDTSYLIPIGLIVLGLYLMIFRKRQSYPDWNGGNDNPRSKRRDPFYMGNPESTVKSAGDNTQQGTEGFNPDSGDVVNSSAVFCGVKKRVLSKNFYGGKISNYFGGTEIDLSQADLSDQAFLDVDVAFGGVKLIVPPHWELRIDVANVFAGVEDKRMYMQSMPDPTKVLVIKGTIVFGGLEIKSF